MTLFLDRRQNRGLAAPLCVKRKCQRRFHFGCFFLLVATLFLPCLCHNLSAQENEFKDGEALYSIGLGYEWCRTLILPMDLRLMYAPVSICQGGFFVN